MKPLVFPPGAFRPEEVAAMGAAFDAAIAALHDTGQPEIVRRIIATRIIEATKRGVRDPMRLRAAALLGLPTNKSSL